MDYVNINFTSESDLLKLNDAMDQLKAEKERIMEVVNKQIDNAENTTDALEGNKGEVVEQVLSILLNLSNDDMNIEAQKIDEAILLYGEMTVLVKARELLNRKKEAIELVHFFERADRIYSDVTELSFADLATVRSILDNLNEFIKDANALNSELITEALQDIKIAFDEKIQHAKEKREREFSLFLKEITWLSSTEKLPTLSSSQRLTLLSYLKDLLEFQSMIKVPKYPETWWGLEVLLSPIFIRFKYHFGVPNKETNKITKPEWALSFMEGILDEILPYLRLVVGYSLEPFFLVLDYEVITTILIPLREKMFEMSSQINRMILASNKDKGDFEKNGRLLSHLFFELASFDQRIRNKYSYNPYIENFDSVPDMKWMGLTGDLLLNGGDSLAASNWLAFELQLATDRLNQDILGSDNAFQLDMNYSRRGSEESNMHVKPSYSAYNVSKLFDTLTSHYRTLSIVKYQLKFVSNIQLKILQLYYEELNKKFEELFGHKFMRSLISSVSKEGEVNKNILSSLETLTGLFNLARYINDKLFEWSNQFIFVQLWSSYVSISKTDEGFAQSLFDGFLNDYEALSNKMIAKFEQIFKKEIKECLKKYVNSTRWDLDVPSEIEPSQDLLLLVNNLNFYLDHLKRCLSDLDYYKITDLVVTTLFTVIREFVITNTQFSNNGIRQLEADFEFISSSFQQILYLRPIEGIPSHVNNRSYQKVANSIDSLVIISENPTIKSKINNCREIREFSSSNLAFLADFEIEDLIRRVL